jgi:hypothetical protein
MYQSSVDFETIAGSDECGARKPADKANTTEPWSLANSPAYQWGRLADAALARGDAQEAAEMIEFAYWAADAGDISASNGYLVAHEEDARRDV